MGKLLLMILAVVAVVAAGVASAAALFVDVFGLLNCLQM